MKIPELNGWFLCNQLTDAESDSLRLLGSVPATQLYKVHLFHINSDPCESGLYFDTQVLPELDGRVLHNHETDFGSVNWTLLSSTPARQ